MRRPKDYGVERAVWVLPFMELAVFFFFFFFFFTRQFTLTVSLSNHARVVQKLDNTIHRVNHYPADSVVCFVNIYPLDSDLSGG